MFFLIAFPINCILYILYIGEKMSIVEQKYLPTTVVVGAEKLIAIRAQLSQLMRQFWSSPDGIAMRTALSRAARNSGFASGMESIMATVADSIKDLAKRTIKTAYKEVWGTL